MAAPRSRHTALRVAVVAALAVAVVASGQPAAPDHSAHASPAQQSTPDPAAGTTYRNDFGSTDFGPAPDPLASGPTFDVLVHSRDRQTWEQLEPMTADHGAMCEPPPATHHLDPMPYAQASFLCGGNPHWMTAIQAGGYGVIYGTPNHLVDFSAGAAVIRFDVSTLRHSERDWIDVWVTPWDDNLTAPLEPSWPDLAGIPNRGLHFLLSPNNTINPYVIEPDAAGVAQLRLLDSKWWGEAGWHNFLTPSSKDRTPVEIRITKDRVKVGMPTLNLWWNWQTEGSPIVPPLDWDRGVVQIGHHSYNPAKACEPPVVCGPTTWHWDNISISPGVPFTMIRANERAAFEQSGGEPLSFTFPQPAPADAYLRVDAIGSGYQVSLDNGVSWTTLRRQPSSRATADGSSAQPYWHPIPDGTRAVQLRTTVHGWWGLGMVDYAAIWAAQSPVAPTPPPVTPTTPPTAVPPATPTAGATSTPPPNPTVAPTSPPVTSTLVPATVVPDPSGQCVVTVSRSGTPVASWDCR